MHPFLFTKPTEASKSQKSDSKFSAKTIFKTKTFQNLNMPPPLVSVTFKERKFQHTIAHVLRLLLTYIVQHSNWCMGNVHSQRSLQERDLNLKKDLLKLYGALWAQTLYKEICRMICLGFISTHSLFILTLSMSKV